MELRTERLTLRHPTQDDLGPLFEIMSNPAAMRFWSTLPHASFEVTRLWLERMIANNQSEGHQFLILLDDGIIGEVGSWRPPDFGFILHPDFWGQGIATEAARAVIGHIFAVTDTPDLQADVDPRNAASLHVLARLGFVETGRAANTFLLGEQWCDSIYLALPRPHVPL
ncbi:GNAT family N-acetyltransferase [Devosia neptuniae]|jgi:ribosomal-protein-alanine N-acetyltransferase|uniref:GNAT family N-acetyltransferase n=1 Tax=Devosia TaxID=46913 RepID=UPI0022AEEC90|nr:GNAT family N-acetyltransferase [Devosia neptuniae]MCZ4345032.1 GNAT family N-acetyltransferase [Devosia neptuniae]|tara:strand:+ start:9359 stop:9865 length:507 start_codon:yes stop_codon:yes gene_type:complete